MNNKAKKRKKIIVLISKFNRLTLKITRLKIEDKQALGLLTEAMQINSQMLSLLASDDSRIDWGFVRQVILWILMVAKEEIGKWLSRYRFSQQCYLKNTLLI